MKPTPFILSMAISTLGQGLGAQTPVQLVGTWNVTSTVTADTNLPHHPKSGVDAYIWIVSANANGEITVNVQGNTSFPKLQGYWRPSTRTLILGAHSIGLEKTACWFKLTLDERGVLHGVRRYLDSTPGFADFDILAKKQ